MRADWAILTPDKTPYFPANWLPVTKTALLESTRLVAAGYVVSPNPIKSTNKTDEELINHYFSLVPDTQQTKKEAWLSQKPLDVEFFKHWWSVLNITEPIVNTELAFYDEWDSNPNFP